VEYSSDGSGTSDFQSTKSLRPASTPAPIEVPAEVHMESLDHMEYLEERIMQMSAQNEFLTNTLAGIVDKLDHLMQTQNPTLPVSEKDDTPSIDNNFTPKGHVKPSLPSDFNGDRSIGHAFLNSCELYIRLANYQFTSESDKISWVLTYMKSRWASLFVDQTLRWESHFNQTMFSVREHLPGLSINQLPQKGTMSELVLALYMEIWDVP